MNKKIKTEAVDHLFQAILTLKNVEECYKFFEDVCTVNELLSCPSATRWQRCCGRRRPIWRLHPGLAHPRHHQPGKPFSHYGNDGYDMVFARVQDDGEDRLDEV